MAVKPIDYELFANTYANYMFHVRLSEAGQNMEEYRYYYRLANELLRSLALQIRVEHHVASPKDIRTWEKWELNSNG